MPSVFKKQEPLRFVLKNDITESPQPAFFARRLTFGQMKAFMGMMERLQSPEGNLVSSFEDLIDTLDDVIVGWEHMGSFIYGENSLGEFLTPHEVMELMMMVLQSSQSSPEEGN
jgi:hypothetical protein